MSKRVFAGVVLGAGGMFAGAAAAQGPLTVSWNDNPTVWGVLYDDEDALLVDAASQTVTVVYTTPSGDLDAFAYLSDGRYAVSTNFNLNVPGVGSFNDGDVVAYDPATGAYEAILLESRWSPAADVCAVAETAAGTLLLSVREPAPRTFTFTGGSVAIGEGDILEWDPATDTASVYLTAGEIVDLTFDNGSAEISGLEVLGDGRLLLTFVGDERIGETVYVSGQIVLFDPADGSATLYADFRDATDVLFEELDALAVPPDEAGCAADMDGDGQATVNDLLAFLGAFRNQGEGSDFDGNGSVDVNDLLGFLGAFRAGCA